MMRILILLAVLTGVSACATLDGIGQDLSSGARSVERMF
ncbi:MAG: entericidin EcnA/B family protein [Paracoccaceae bacterium]